MWKPRPNGCPTRSGRRWPAWAAGRTGARLDPAAVPLADREAFAAWLKHIVADRHQTGASPDSIASITLLLVADADGPGGSRGFVVARAHPDGTTEHATSTKRPQVFTRDFSFRDYFHGAGTREGEEGKPHPVARATHICNPYRSQGDDRSSTGKLIHRPWKVDAVTPICEAPGGRVVGLLSFGLNLESDVVSLLEPVDLGARGSAKLDIASKVKVVLVDDRNNWVWHPDCRNRLKDDRPGVRLPHDYRALALARGVDPADALPWLGIGVPEEGRPFGYAKADRYVDLVEAQREDADPNDAPEIACFTLFHPYAQSKYEEMRPRRWVFVAQVDRQAALAPLNDLRTSIVKVGAVAGAVLILIALGLWVGLVVVLRRVEFASHG
ncbi:cache domain-containing protein [Frigoriglobus tundricola]|uniref:Uncharacterized protein n=1 Tax=Frigoriglobus tundricola TaxID=2774151 RepID=A0A6M5Z0A5_9BACT|nr:cache domain-containing protein [Frigoriglobus tundricola]QJW99588.1 hypothetical protein FTUN_7200 [Frigoriglobus tundricola]